MGGSAPERESDLLGPAVGRRAVDVFRGVRAAPDLLLREADASGPTLVGAIVGAGLARRRVDVQRRRGEEEARVLGDDEADLSQRSGEASTGVREKARMV